MIKPIFKGVGASDREQLQHFREATENEDEDFVKVAPEKETNKIAKSLDELRKYIQDSKITRKVTHVVVHCTATQPTATVTAILNYWKNVRKWKNVGYHILIGPEGFTVMAGFDSITNGALGYNATGIHISYIGGIDANGKPKDTRTAFQKEAIEICLTELTGKLSVKVIGHNEVANKACPSFKVQKEYEKHWTGK